VVRMAFENIDELGDCVVLVSTMERYPLEDSHILAQFPRPTFMEE